MPKSKEFVSDSDSENGEGVPKKKTKVAKVVSKPAKDTASNEDNSKSFPLGKKKFATVSEFRGSKFVNIREYYDCDGTMKPGKKGIALSVEQWKELKLVFASIDKALEEF